MTAARPPAQSTGALEALSPIDGRYAEKCAELRPVFSEAGLIRRRTQVEALWFLHLARDLRLPELQATSAAVLSAAEELARGAGPDEAARVKAEERRINHDVKAVEYYVRARLEAAGASEAQLEFVHFACTS